MQVLQGIMSSEKEKNGSKRLEMMLWGASIFLLITIGIVLLFGTSSTGKATLFIWILACLAGGGALGFLFGVPKIVQATSTNNATEGQEYQQQVNTNLTEISDWLTKIIVGLGLIHLGKIHYYLNKLAALLAGALHSSQNNPRAVAFAYGLIICYTIFGFLTGYLGTRLYLAAAFSQADQEAIRRIEKKANEAVGVAKSADQKSESAIASSESRSYSNEEMMLQHPGKLDELVEKYNQTRLSMPSGYSRTKTMSAIAWQMVRLTSALPDFDPVSAMDDEQNGGKRLAGYPCVYSKPLPEHLEPLVQSLVAIEDTPFGQWWAIQALGKILVRNPDLVPSPSIVKRLNTFRIGLPLTAEDRKSELKKILADLEQRLLTQPNFK